MVAGKNDVGLEIAFGVGLYCKEGNFGTSMSIKSMNLLLH